MKRRRTFTAKLKDGAIIVLCLLGVTLAILLILATLIFLSLGTINFFLSLFGYPASLHEVIWYGIGLGATAFVIFMIRLSRRSRDE